MVSINNDIKFPRNYSKETMHQTKKIYPHMLSKLFFDIDIFFVYLLMCNSFIHTVSFLINNVCLSMRAWNYCLMLGWEKFYQTRRILQGICWLIELLRVLEDRRTVSFSWWSLRRHSIELHFGEVFSVKYRMPSRFHFPFPGSSARHKQNTKQMKF